MNARHLRTIFLRVAAMLTLLVVACSSESDVDTSWSAKETAQDAEAPVIPILVNSQLGVGQNRITFGFFDGGGALVSDLTADVRLFTLDGDAGTLVSEHELRKSEVVPNLVHTHAHGTVETHASGSVAIFAAVADLASGGQWGAELNVDYAGERTQIRSRFFVLDRTAEPMIGEAIPRFAQRVLSDVDDITEIDSANPPLVALHELTVPQALDAGRPIVIAFATPAFCQTRFCGPVIDSVMQPLHAQYGDEATFIHIEPFDLAAARAGQLVAVPAMEQWALTTEPWVFIVDSAGTVAAKFEGVMMAAEVEAALLPLIR